jgi:hypothetical protein
LGVAFYRAGLMDEAYSCFESSEIKIREIEKSLESTKERSIGDFSLDYFENLDKRIKWSKLRAKLNFQNCILYSENS